MDVFTIYYDGKPLAFYKEMFNKQQYDFRYRPPSLAFQLMSAWEKTRLYQTKGGATTALAYLRGHYARQRMFCWHKITPQKDYGWTQGVRTKVKQELFRIMVNEDCHGGLTTFEAIEDTVKIDRIVSLKISDSVNLESKDPHWSALTNMGGHIVKEGKGYKIIEIASSLLYTTLDGKKDVPYMNGTQKEIDYAMFNRRLSEGFKSEPQYRG